MKDYKITMKSWGTSEWTEYITLDSDSFVRIQLNLACDTTLEYYKVEEII